MASSINRPPNPDDVKTTLELGEWSDTLIRHVANVNPSLLRTDMVFALPESAGPDYARQVAYMTLEVEELDFLDAQGYWEDLKASFDAMSVEGSTWYIYKDDEPDLAGAPQNTKDAGPTTLKRVEIASPDWSDELIAAAAQAAPQLYRSDEPYAWAISEHDLETFALWHATEGCSEPEVMRFFDLPAYIEHLKATDLVAVQAQGQVWYLFRDSLKGTPDYIMLGRLEDDGVMPLRYWPDELVAAVGAQAPGKLRIDTPDETFAVADNQVRAYLRKWWVQDIAAENVESYIDQAIEEHFALVSCGDQKWRIYTEADIKSDPA